MSKISLHGSWNIQKFRRQDYEAGHGPYEEIDFDNSLVTSGRQQLLDLFIGDTSSNRLDSNSVLRIQRTSPSGTTTLTGLESGYPQVNADGSSGQVQLRWVDDTTDTYTPQTMRVYFQGNNIQLSETSVSFGSKPSNEIWIYTWTLEMEGDSGNGPEGDVYIVEDGIEMFFNTITGINVEALSSSFTQLEVRTDTSDTCSGGSLLSDITADSASRSGTTVTWTFSTTGGQGDWQCYAIKSSLGTDFRRGPWVNTTPGSQPANNERTVTYTLTLD